MEARKSQSCSEVCVDILWKLIDNEILTPDEGGAGVMPAWKPQVVDLSELRSAMALTSCLW